MVGVSAVAYNEDQEPRRTTAEQRGGVSGEDQDNERQTEDGQLDENEPGGEGRHSRGGQSSGRHVV